MPKTQKKMVNNMIFDEKIIILKNGQNAILKTPCIEDAEMLLNSIKTSSGETEFLTTMLNIGIMFLLKMKKNGYAVSVNLKITL